MFRELLPTKEGSFRSKTTLLAYKRQMLTCAFKILAAFWWLFFGSI